MAMAALQVAHTAAAAHGASACRSKCGNSAAIHSSVMISSGSYRIVGRPFNARSRPLQHRRWCMRATAAAANASAVALKLPDGSILALEKDAFSVGSSKDADLRVTGGNVEQQHATLERRSGRVFCTALAGDEDDMFADTCTWLDGSQLRRGVAYLVAPGAQLAFGDQQQHYTVEFEEVGSASPAMEMLMKSMASGGSDEVRKRLENA